MVQKHRKIDDEEDCMRNAQLLTLWGQKRGTPMKTWKEVVDKGTLDLE